MSGVECPGAIMPAPVADANVGRWYDAREIVLAALRRELEAIPAGYTTENNSGRKAGLKKAIDIITAIPL